MACFYADKNIPAEKETGCFHSFLVEFLVDSGRCAGFKVKLSE